MRRRGEVSGAPEMVQELNRAQNSPRRDVRQELQDTQLEVTLPGKKLLWGGQCIPRGLPIPLVGKYRSTLT